MCGADGGIECHSAMAVGGVGHRGADCLQWGAFKLTLSEAMLDIQL